MSSSRSIAAARNRRSGDPTPKILSQQPMRPVTSISSQSAFSNQPYAGNNIRVSGKQQMQQTNFTQQKNSNGLPFSKLTVSDAIGLVTLRLGRVEQFMIDFQEQEGEHGQKMGTLPENTKLVDNSVLNNIINRLDSLEKKESSQLKNDVIVKLEKELDHIKLVLETLSNSLQLYEKNTNEKFIDYENAIVEIENKDSLQEKNDVIVKLEKESDHLKVVLETLSHKLDLHEKNTNEKFIDYENAIVEIEKSLLSIENSNYQQTEQIEENNQDSQVLEESNQESQVEESNQDNQESQLIQESESNEIQS